MIIYTMSYCGIGKIPKGKKRGTVEQCIKANQIRYYGLEKIKLDDINKTKKKKLDYDAEVIKRTNLLTQAKNLLEKIKTAKAIIAIEDIPAKKRKQAKDDLAYYFIKRDTIIKKLKQQDKIVKDLMEKPSPAKKKKTTKKK